MIKLQQNPEQMKQEMKLVPKTYFDDQPLVISNEFESLFWKIL